MFGRDESGNVALLFGLMLPTLMVGVGGGIEVSRAVEYKQRLTSATDLACRQAEVWIEGTQADNPSKNYAADVQAYADKNKAERNLTTATITATPTKSASVLGVVGIKPGNVHVTATGTVDFYFKSFLTRNNLSFTVVRDCTVNASTSTGPPTLMMSESFEGNTSKLNGGWRVFSTLGVENCQSSSACGTKTWSTSGAGLEVNELGALTGDGIVYGKAFAELDSDCANQDKATTENRAACNNGATNSSLWMNLTLDPGTYEVRYVYVARKNVPAGSATGLPKIPATNAYAYEYPNDPVICSKSTDTTYSARDTSVSKTKSGDLTMNMDKQTRRIELYVEPKSSNYTMAQANMVDVCVWAKGWTERSYKFTVPRSSEYRITWIAKGNDDSFGGLIDYLRFCRNDCP